MYQSAAGRGHLAVSYHTDLNARHVGRLPPPLDGQAVRTGARNRLLGADMRRRKSG